MKAIKMACCSKCQEKIEREAKVCPHCQAKRNDWQRNPLRTFLILSGFGLFVMVISSMGETSTPEERQAKDLESLAKCVKSIPEENIVFKWNDTGSKVTVNGEYSFKFVNRDDSTGILYYKNNQQWFGATVSFGSLAAFALGDTKNYVTDAIEGM
ncbi:MAG: hypothetical protein ACRCV0_01755 [Brevinema sp.]